MCVAGSGRLDALRRGEVQRVVDTARGVEDALLCPDADVMRLDDPDLRPAILDIALRASMIVPPTS